MEPKYPSLPSLNIIIEPNPKDQSFSSLSVVIGPTLKQWNLSIYRCHYLVFSLHQILNSGTY